MCHSTNDTAESSAESLTSLALHPNPVNPRSFLKANKMGRTGFPVMDYTEQRRAADRELLDNPDFDPGESGENMAASVRRKG